MEPHISKARCGRPAVVEDADLRHPPLNLPAGDSKENGRAGIAETLPKDARRKMYSRSKGTPVKAQTFGEVGHSNSQLDFSAFSGRVGLEVQEPGCATSGWAERREQRQEQRQGWLSWFPTLAANAAARMGHPRCWSRSGGPKHGCATRRKLGWATRPAAMRSLNLRLPYLIWTVPRLGSAALAFAITSAPSFSASRMVLKSFGPTLEGTASKT